MSLADIYRDAWKKKFGLGKGWQVAWPGPGVAIGQRGVMNDDEFMHLGRVGDYGVSFDFDPEPPKDGGAWDYSSSAEISAEIGADADVPGWSWLGNASAGLSVAFGKDESIYLSASSSIVERVANVDQLKSDLITTAVKMGMPEGQSVVIERQLARMAVLVASEGGGGGLKATVDGKVKVLPGTQGSVASLAGRLNFHSKSGSTFMQKFPNEFIMAYRVVTLGSKGWWFSRHPTVDGILPVGVSTPEDFFTPDDYFVSIK